MKAKLFGACMISLLVSGTLSLGDDGSRASVKSAPVGVVHVTVFIAGEFT